MRYVLLLAAMIAIAGLGHAQAQGIRTVEDLRANCQETANNARRGFCAGFILGVYQGENAFEVFTNEDIFCHREKTVSGAQLRQIFLNWANDNPEQWQAPMVSGVILAMFEAFPCDVPPKGLRE